jgi:murein DD-endopeptidase MepM/ murein hydrolase activator NlpD
MALKIIHYHGLLSENRRQQKQIEFFLNETKRLRDGVQDLEARDQELRELLGIETRRVRPKRVEPGTPQSLNFKTDQIRRNLAWVKDSIQTQRQSFKQLASLTKQFEDKFADLPSLWPVPGEIKSTFGWRHHPFIGSDAHHNGVDIPTWTGSPVRSAGDGVVVYSGWSKGYGNTIMIDHGNTYQTIYAHNSMLLVRTGQRVAKGQMLAKAGSTGLSTGPHVHYEVRVNNHPIAPTQYLDLNIQTAKNYIQLVSL